MSRIHSFFNQHAKKALIPFITAGYPDIDSTVTLMHTLVTSGADIIELGMPFSDPMADGPTIQYASEQALNNGTNLAEVLMCVKNFRTTNTTTPIVLMGYLNPIEHMTYEAFAKAAYQAGVDGCLIVDSPPEESECLAHALKEQSIDLIYLIAPNSTDERVTTISKLASGYLYYVSMKGITGTKTIDMAEVGQTVSHLKSLTELPIGVGFGIKDAESAGQTASVADAVIVGSAYINLITKHKDNLESMHQAIAEFTVSLRQAIDDHSQELEHLVCY